MRYRLFVQSELEKGKEISLSKDQAHYVQNVVRLQVGDDLALFNGRDGEWRAVVSELGKRVALVRLLECVRPQIAEPMVRVLFAPVKKQAMEMIVEKSVELGATHIQPVLTDYTDVVRFKQERAAAQAVEAAEQCGRLTVPEVAGEQKLKQILADWPQSRPLFWGDETGQGVSALTVMRAAWQPDVGILVGPEGGFSEAERAWLRTLSFVHPIDLGQRILRADTAVIVTLALMQAAHP